MTLTRFTFVTLKNSGLCATQDGHNCTFPFIWANLRYENCYDVDTKLGWCVTNGELIPDLSHGSFGFCDGNCQKYEPLFRFKEEDNELLSACCQEPDLKLCKAATIHVELLQNEQDIEVMGKILSFNHTIQPSGLVYLDTNGNQAIIR